MLGPVSVTAQKDLFSPRGEKKTTRKNKTKQKRGLAGLGEKGMKLIVTEENKKAEKHFGVN